MHDDVASFWVYAPAGQPPQRRPVTDITVIPDRMRRLRPDVVDELAESIAAQGLLHPITLRKRASDGAHVLVAGRHRLEAVRKLGYQTVAAVILDGADSDRAQLVEIDENLVRADPTPAERAAHQAKRKEIYERLHPDTKAGAAQAKGMNAAQGRGRQNGDHVGRYTADAAKKTGKSERSIQREAARGAAIPDVAALAGTSLDKRAELDALARLPPDEQHKLAERAKAGEKVSAKTHAKKIKRDAREQTLAAKQLALPNKGYGVIVADPEWRFEPWSRHTGLDRAADNHYSTSCTEVIAARDVHSIAADDCVLFLWATGPMLPHALLIMATWGFNYKSHYVWGKDKVGTGFWNREKHELLLIGTRGDVPCPAPGTQWASLIMAPRGRHSAKPECFLDMIEQYFPTLPKIELNRRGAPRPGWDAWGNEADAPADDRDGVPGFLDGRSA
jgi:N6-adenosine-specific RNA methylase IME4